MKQVEGLDEWQIKAWIMQLGSFPVAVIKQEDLGAGYEKRNALALELQDGKFALVVEEGCSCYSSEQAKIDILPSRRKVLMKLEEWRKQKIS